MSSTPASASTNRLVGRDDAVRELSALMASSRLVTLTGTGGVGKTRLALELADLAKAQLGLHVAFVALEGLTDATLIADEVANALLAGSRQDSAMAAVRETLAARPTLVILDNCEQLLDGARRIVDDLLATTDAKFLVTSRQRLALEAERAWRVPSLALPDAVEMFADRARSVVASFALEGKAIAAVERICRRLDGIPLAIELTAPRLRYLRPAELASLLEQRAQMLSPVARGRSDRQRTLGATISWSYELLDGAQQRRLRAVATFAGAWTLEAASAVCDDDPQTLRDAFEQLIEASIVVPTFVCESPGYRLLQPIREFLLTLGDDEERSRFRNAHATFFCGLATANRSDTGIDLHHFDRLEASLQDLRAFFQWTTYGGGDRMQGLTGAIGLSVFWRRRGFAIEGLGWMKHALAAAPDPPVSKLVQGYHAASRLALSAGRLQEAMRLALRALGFARAAGDAQSEARILNSLGVICAARGNVKRASVLHRAHLDYARSVGDNHKAGLSLVDLGIGELHIGRNSVARELLREAIDLLRPFGDQRNLAEGLLHLGMAEFALANPTGALAALEEALALADEVRDQGLRAGILCEFAGLFVEVGDTVRAREALTGAVRDIRDAGYDLVMPRAFDLTAALLVAEQNYRDAAKALGAAEALYARLGASRSLVRQAMIDGLWATLRANVGGPLLRNLVRSGDELRIEDVLLSPGGP